MLIERSSMEADKQQQNIIFDRSRDDVYLIHIGVNKGSGLFHYCVGSLIIATIYGVNMGIGGRITRKAKDEGLANYFKYLQGLAISAEIFNPLECRRCGRCWLFITKMSDWN